MNDELAPEIKLEILQQKRSQYLQARYDAVIESKIADLLEDAELKKTQVERLKRIQKAIELIEQEIKSVT